MLTLRRAGISDDLDHIPIMYENLSLPVVAKTHRLNVHVCVSVGDRWMRMPLKTQVTVLVHEFLHALDPKIIDIAYRFEPDYARLTDSAKLHNADSLTELIMRKYPTHSVDSAPLFYGVNVGRSA